MVNLNIRLGIEILARRAAAWKRSDYVILLHNGEPRIALLCLFAAHSPDDNMFLYHCEAMPIDDTITDRFDNIGRPSTYVCTYIMYCICLAAVGERLCLKHRPGRVNPCRCGTRDGANTRLSNSIHDRVREDEQQSYGLRGAQIRHFVTAIFPSLSLPTQYD